MPEQSDQSVSTTSPAKLALAGVLAVVFVVVLIVQFGGAEGAVRQPDARRPRPPITGVPAVPPRSGDLTESPPAPWPTLDLADLLRYDPFALPTGPNAFEPEPLTEGADVPSPGERPSATMTAGRDNQETARVLQAYSAIRQQGVSAILGSAEKGYVAIIGSETVSVDDTLQGFSVVSIGPDGVVLEPSKAALADDKPSSGKE